MADPVGVLGTALGTVSLGLQTYQSLNAYVADFIAREEKVTTTLTELANFEQTIDKLNTAVQICQANNLIPLDANLSLLQSCKDQIERLRRQLQDYQLSPTTGTLPRLQKKLGYPLNRGKLDELEKSLHNSTSYLLILVGALGLFSSTSIGRSVQAVGDTQQIQTSLITNMDKKLDEMKTFYQETVAQLNSLHVGTDDLIHALQSMMTQISIQSEAQKTEIQIAPLRLQQSGEIRGADVDRLSTSEFESRTVVSTGLTAKRGSSDYVQSAPSDAKKSSFTSIVSQNAVVSASGLSPDEPRMSQTLTKADRRSSLNRSCTCSVRTRRRTTRTTAHWKYFSLYSLYSSEDTSPAHEPECGLYLADLATRCWILGISFTGLRWICRRAISMQYALRYDATGYSIDRLIRYYPMVDDSQSPAFRIVRLAYRGLRVLRYGNAQFDHSKYMSSVLSKLREVFMHRRASPLDVNSRGMTLIDYLMHLENLFFPDEELDIYIHSSITKLLDFQVSLDAQTLVSYTISHERYDFSDNGIQSRLIQIMRSALHRGFEPDYGQSVEIIDYLRYSAVIAEIPELASGLELDALCQALFKKDLAFLRYALANQSQCLENFEEYTLKKPLVELALRWPAGLETLIQYPFESVKDYLATAGFETVISACNVLCCAKNGSNLILDIFCQSCDCSEPLKILLEHKCYLSEEMVEKIFRDANPGTIWALIEHIGKWRRDLENILSLSLKSDLEAQHGYTSDGRLLDVGAPRAVSLLRSHGIFPHTKFGLRRDDYRLSQRLGPGGAKSIYHNISMHTSKWKATDELAQRAYDLGFWDLDTEFNRRTPLMHAYQLDHNEKYVMWLVNHQASLLRPFTWTIVNAQRHEGSYTVPKHTVLHKLCRLDRWITCQSMTGFCAKILPHVIATAGDNRLADGCTCPCAPPTAAGRVENDRTGCLPLTVLLNHLFDLYDFGRGMTTELLDFLDQVQEHAEVVIRCLTFRRLHIRHTCCLSQSASKWRQDQLPHEYDSDFKELREEDQDLICLLNSLMDEFASEYRTEALPLSKFLTGTWMRRTNAIVRDYRDDSSILQNHVLSAMGVKMTEGFDTSDDWMEWFVEENTKPMDISKDLVNSTDVGGLGESATSTKTLENDLKDVEDYVGFKDPDETLCNHNGLLIGDRVYAYYKGKKRIGALCSEFWDAELDIIASGGRSRFEDLYWDI